MGNDVAGAYALSDAVGIGEGQKSREDGRNQGRGSEETHFALEKNGFVMK
jgi:hypothetical protein